MFDSARTARTVDLHCLPSTSRLSTLAPVFGRFTKLPSERASRYYVNANPIASLPTPLTRDARHVKRACAKHTLLRTLSPTEGTRCPSDDRVPSLQAISRGAFHTSRSRQLLSLRCHDLTHSQINAICALFSTPKRTVFRGSQLVHSRCYGKERKDFTFICYLNLTALWTSSYRFAAVSSKIQLRKHVGAGLVTSSDLQCEDFQVFIH